MQDPSTGFNVNVIQSWSDVFWKKTMFIWLPPLVIFKMFRYYTFGKKERDR
jgi:hypothetical protein